MTAKEMFELAKAGYKPAEIAEMHKLMKDADIEPMEEPTPEPMPEPMEEPKVELLPDPKEEPKEEPIDYKKLYEENQKALSALQQKNIKQDAGANAPKDEDILANLVRGFM